MTNELCKRCLLQESAGNASDHEQALIEFHNQLPTEQRADDELYAMRLQLCARCDALFLGVCSYCGCYVEMRAMVNTKHCPLPVSPRW